MPTRTTHVRRLVFGIAVILLSAFVICELGREDAATNGKQLTREQAVAVVRKSVCDTIREPNPVPLDISAGKDKDGNWIVVVWYLPARPGRFTIYVLDGYGRILRCRHGDA